MRGSIQERFSASEVQYKGGSVQGSFKAREDQIVYNFGTILYALKLGNT